MAFITHTRMVICYGNVMTQEAAPTFTLTNITEDPSTPAANLAFPDPWALFRVPSGNASNRIIQIDFGSAPALMGCIGFANHDLFTGYDTVALDYWTGSAWSNVGTQTLTGQGGGGNPNFLLRFTPISGVTRYRVTLGKTSGTRPGFYIGMMFLGKVYEVTTNPVEGGLFLSQEVPLQLLTTVGGAILAPAAPPKYTESLEASFARTSKTMFQVLSETILRNSVGKVIGIIHPEGAEETLPTGSQHLFGYISKLSPSPRNYGKYDITMVVEGAV